MQISETMELTDLHAMLLALEVLYRYINWFPPNPSVPSILPNGILGMLKLVKQSQKNLPSPPQI